MSSIAEGNRELSAKAEALDLLQRGYAAAPLSAASIPLPSSPPLPGSHAEAERIRSLESALHASASRIHELSRQLTDMHAAYATAQRERDDALLAAPFSPASTRGFFLSPADETTPSRSPGLGSGLGLGRPPSVPSRSSVDTMLPASVRQRRQVSLTALKARMEHPPRSKPLTSPSRMEAVTEKESEGVGGGGGGGGGGEGGGRRGSGVATPQRLRKQFGDEIVFCCPACEGDLITL